MQPKFTRKSGWRPFRYVSVLALSCVLLTGLAHAQQYVNGNLSTGATHAGTGTAAPAGTTWSELQGANTGLGFGANITASFTLADNFVVPAGPSWNVTKITFFAYSTGYAGATSPFVDTRVQIFNTDPSVGNPAPIFGDLTTNRFLASTSASIYRTSGTTADQSRRVWRIEATVNVNLAPGTYWVEWAHGNGGLSNFTPPSTVAGQPTPPGGNSKQRNFSGGLPGTWTNIVDAGGGGAQDQHFIIDYTTGACAGTPAPGNTLSSLASVCPGINFTLSLQNATPGSGVTYQWQSAPSSTGPWTNITGATNSTLSTTLTATTWYQCNVTCSGNTGTSTPVEVMLTPSSGCYCNAGATSTSFEKISRVRFNTIDNSSTSTAGYENFTTISTDVIKGQTLPLTVNISGAFSSDQVLVWIDFNQNGSFTDAGEQVYVSTQGVGPHTGNVTISPTALTGPTRMRIRMHDAALGGNTTPCGNSTYGQVEDYTVNILPCTPITITSSPASTSVTCGNNATFTVATTGSAPSYSWEYRVNASSAWQLVTNGGNYAGATTPTLTVSNVDQSFSGYQFRALVSGACSAIDFSGTATLTVTAIVPVVNPASATICAGTIQQLTLTNTTSAPNTVTFNATGMPLAIPDNNPAGVTTTTTVSGIPAGSVINNVRVTFNMTHTWVGDIVMNLRAPNGQTLNLIGLLDNGTGSNGTDNFVNTSVDSTATTPMSGAPAPRTGVFRADRFTATVPTSAPTTTNNWLPLLGTMNGDWALAICDLGAADLGNLTSWSISITYTAPAFAQGTWGGPAGTIFTDAAATVPYTGTPATTVYVQPTVTSNYTVSFTTPTPCTSATTTIPVTVVNPVTNVVNPTNQSVCVGGSTTFTASASGGPLTYQWQVSTDGGTTWSNISGATSSTLSLTNVTQSMSNNRYRVVFTAAPCTGSVNSTAAILTVNALPNVTISSPDTYLAPGQTTTITASSTPAAAAGGWSWTLNGSAIPGTGNTQTANVDGLGVYQATVTDINGCVSTSNQLTIEAEATDKLWIYPNPTSGLFQVRLYYDSDVAERRIVSIYNQLGQIITSRQITLVDNTPPYLQMDFDLRHVSRGTYVVKVAHQYTGKIVSGLVVIQ